MVTSSGRSMTLCDELVFDGIPYPWEFLLSFCYDTGKIRVYINMCVRRTRTHAHTRTHLSVSFIFVN